MRKLLLLSLLLVSACSTPGGPYPSLQPRAAESIDPRVPISRPINDRPVSGPLAARLAALIDQARSGDAAFNSAAAAAERLASGAATVRSESWIAAQEALSAAIAARRPVAAALSDIDELGATRLQAYGWHVQKVGDGNDLAAINRAAAEVGSLDRRQAERIAALQRRLAS